MPSNSSPNRRRGGADSLATHQPGSSFAQKARAAELKAARARTHVRERRIQEESATLASHENEDDGEYIGGQDDGAWEEPRRRMLLHGHHPLGPREVSLDEFRVVKRVRTKKGKGGGARAGAHAREESLVSVDEVEGAAEDSGTGEKGEEIGRIRILKPEHREKKVVEEAEMKTGDFGVMGMWKHDKFAVEGEGEMGTGGSDKKMVMTEGNREGNFTTPNLDHRGQTFQTSAITVRNTSVPQPSHHQQILTGHSPYQQGHAHPHQQVYASPAAQQYPQPTAHTYTYNHQHPSLLNTNPGFSPQLYPNYSRIPFQNHPHQTQSVEQHHPKSAPQNPGQSTYSLLPTQNLDPVRSAYVSPYAHSHPQQSEKSIDPSTAPRLRPGPGVTAYQRHLAENARKAAAARENTAKGTTTSSDKTQGFEGLCFSPPPVSEITGISEDSTRPPSSAFTPDLGFDNPNPDYGMSRHTSYASQAKQSRVPQASDTTRDTSDSGYMATG